MASAQEVTRDTEKLLGSNSTESHRNQTHTTAIDTPIIKEHSQSQNQRQSDQLLGQMPASIQGFSVNRNSLISGDSVLQRQLREKAKQDSLESIKMHILMRLNLKKLPNITKPINVPQNILENFYKNYNSSLLNSMWGQKSKPNGAAIPAPNKPGSALYMHEDTVTDSVNVTQNIKQSSNNNSKYEASNRNTSLEMQGDDPNNFKDFQYIYNIEIDKHQTGTMHKATEFTINDDDIEYESILSHINRVYIFPEQPHVRHNRKTDVLRFKFESGSSDISYVTLHLYLRGLEWISIYQPKMLEELSDFQNKEIVVALHRAIRRANNTNYTHKAKIFEFRHKIPTGLGQWVNVDLKPLIGTGAAIDPSQTQEIFIKGVEPWMRPLVVTTDSTAKNPLTVHIEIGSRKKHRRKRSVYLDCTENDHDMRCCRYPLKVNFTSFGWHFVVAPTSFDAYFCSGDCRVGYLEQYPHTHLAALTTSATPCCSPTKMSSLSLLYFDENHQLVLSVIPNMSVEGCSCS
ncbi:bone morphogenetic protein 4 isoform X2 [Drosophila mojavensis]|uniref:bone morphogenetic protein 4 isoform X2 n=1 Tax=Drosophila mojavensis TaxID=7230 RepID=UPI001CD13E54|nr:bone morphogenetic protein 4 isoform X2 [Drosophila mojavensis]